MMSNKRSRGEIEKSMAATMVKCLSLLSCDNGDIDYDSVIQQQRMPTSIQGRIYDCKTCNKEFPSFQALGGHRASHKKPRLMELYSSDNQSISDNQKTAKKQKIHQCSICGLKFGIGQALGGHMRRHRAAMNEFSSAKAAATTTGLSSSSSDYTDISFQEDVLPQVPVLKKSNSSRRVLNMMGNKRSKGEMEDISIASMEKFLMLLSSGQGEVDPHPVVQKQATWRSSRSRVYECKTCNRQFSSFQALGGHRASHKKPRLVNQISSDSPSGKQQMRKPKTHECSICGLEFSVGQALGGHMRKHRATLIEISPTTEAVAATTTELSSPSSDITDSTTHEKHPLIPEVKKSNNRILSLNLDLNLSGFPTTTMDSNDFEFSTLVTPHKQTSVPPTIYSFI
ncbi:hypothetical protein MKW98_007601 [Papaver atlanticum]|uniref:C2H2-type domain-containing protein n=1 Tax=Papaver atlanticum TaxID=357466 RepID=A0AAD4X9Z4_9MAGN|nr:hypothetical protein MKW98_007601 [Papaver atlanticum]